jgi:hypothetical protein
VLSLHIHITKEIIFQSLHCDADNDFYRMGKNCAIALALREFFPEAHVTSLFIFPFGMDDKKTKDLKIPLPLVAQQFVKLFDGFHLVPNLRLLLPEFDFIIELADEIIDAINIDDIKEVVSNSNGSLQLSRHTQ